MKRGFNGYTDPDPAPQCMCVPPLPKLLDELVTLKTKFPVQRISMREADVSDAFMKVRVDPDQAHNICYTVGDLVVIDFRLTFGWPGSPGGWGVMSAAAEHAHCNVTLNSLQLSDEGKYIMAHVEGVGRWEEGTPTPIPLDT